MTRSILGLLVLALATAPAAGAVSNEGNGWLRLSGNGKEIAWVHPDGTVSGAAKAKSLAVMTTMFGAGGGTASFLHELTAAASARTAAARTMRCCGILFSRLKRGRAEFAPEAKPRQLRLSPTEP